MNENLDGKQVTSRISMLFKISKQRCPALAIEALNIQEV
jgi:hypothetical protein